MNAKAMVFFGIDIGDETPDFLAADDGVPEEFDEWVLMQVGMESWDAQKTEEQRRTYWQRKEEALAAFPVSLVMTSSGDYPYYALIVNGTLQSADWDSPKALATPTVTPEQVQAFKDFCAKHDVELTEEPGWLLAAYYG